MIIVRMGADEIVKMYFHFQERDVKNNMNWAALSKHMLVSTDWAKFRCTR
jgi:hypothetical protein